MIIFKNIKNINSFVLRILLLFLLSFSFSVYSQGWSFQFSVAYAGCSGAVAVTLPTIPNNAFSTQAQCESMRQQILAIKQGGAGCLVYFICTPCVGSDIIIPGQSVPAQISSDGQFEGKPLFTTHQSNAFEDWAKDYKQQLESYGIKSILGNTITLNQNVPLSGNDKVDKLYQSEVDNFNPKGKSKNNTNDLDLSNSSGVVGLLTSKQEQANRDKWYSENGFNDLKTISNDQGLDENEKPIREIKEGVLRTLIGEAPGAAGIAGNMGINTLDASMDAMNTGLGYIKNGDNAGAEAYGNKLLKGEVAFNSIKKTAEGFATDKVLGVFSPLLKAVKGAEYVYKGIKFGLDVQENRKP